MRADEQAGGERRRSPRRDAGGGDPPPLRETPREDLVREELDRHDEQLGPGDNPGRERPGG